MLPIFFRLGPIIISPYGILITAGFFLGLWIAALTASRREGLSQHQIWDFGITMAILALLGAKLLMVLTDPYYYLDLRNILSTDFFRSAGVFYGGFIVAIGWSAWYFWRNKLPGWRVADAFSLGIPFGHFLGRVGCFTAGCCHGRQTSSWLHVTFHDELSFVDPKLLGIPLYPTQLMEAAANLIIFGLLFFLYRRKKFHGQMILAYVMMYAVARFLIEFLRGDDRGWVLPNTLSTSQFIAMIAFFTALGLYLYRRRRALR